MTKRQILIFPDVGLRLKSAPVEAFDESLQELAGDLLETMRAAPGIGITAPHIGVLKRVVVLELPGAIPAFYVNPRVDWFSSEMMRHDEGSVSMPGVSETVERPASVRITYQNLAGEVQTDTAEGLLSICLQHEIDQLDGTFWIYRLSRLKRDRITKRFSKIHNVVKD